MKEPWILRWFWYNFRLLFCGDCYPAGVLLFVTMCTVEGARQTAKSLRGDGAAAEAERQQRKGHACGGELRQLRPWRSRSATLGICPALRSHLKWRCVAL